MAARVLTLNLLILYSHRATAARATFIEGGCFLAFNTSHVLMDVTSVITVIAALARHAADISSVNIDNEVIPDFKTSAELRPHFGPTPSDLGRVAEDALLRAQTATFRAGEWLGNGPDLGVASSQMFSKGSGI